ncbi:unnamed protein product [Symbiodinium natans]|uniref:Uncharacterized protein n=1 Tax=Symbiodinium natans TaxID=878477 RepID=A0A812I124_9DINO|nr:unnamed protein product [Symbiodinium natans]
MRLFPYKSVLDVSGLNIPVLTFHVFVLGLHKNSTFETAACASTSSCRHHTPQFEQLLPSRGRKRCLAVTWVICCLSPGACAVHWPIGGHGPVPSSSALRESGSSFSRMASQRAQYPLVFVP